MGPRIIETLPILQTLLYAQHFPACNLSEIIIIILNGIKLSRLEKISDFVHYISVGYYEHHLSMPSQVDALTVPFLPVER